MCLEATEREALATDARSTSRSASLIGRKVVCCGDRGPFQFIGGDLTSAEWLLGYHGHRRREVSVRDDAVKLWIPVQVQLFFWR